MQDYTIVFLIGLGIGIVITLLFLKRAQLFSHRRNYTSRLPGIPNSSAQADDQEAMRLYSNLLKKAMGNKEQVERLVALERKKTPSASRKVLLRNAIDSWERDNRW